MRSFTKSTRPQTVTVVQCAATTNLATVASARDAFNQLDKTRVREALVGEQGHLCAFCMRAIDHEAKDANGQPTTVIAHRVPIKVDSSLALTWPNLLASCDGGRHAKTGTKTCDFAQENTAVALDPTSPPSVKQLRYVRGDPSATPSTGETRETREGFYLRTDNPQLRDDIKTLGLNRGDLPDLRAAALKAFRVLLDRAHKPGVRTPAMKATFFATWRAQRAPRLPEYVGVVEAWVAGQNMRCQ